MGELDLRIALADSKIEKIKDIQLVTNRSCDRLERALQQMQDKLLAALDRLEEKLTAHLDPTTARERLVDLEIGGDSISRTSVTKEHLAISAREEDARVAQKVVSWPPTDLASPRSALHGREYVTKLEAYSELQIKDDNKEAKGEMIVPVIDRNPDKNEETLKFGTGAVQKDWQRMEMAEALGKKVVNAAARERQPSYWILGLTSQRSFQPVALLQIGFKSGLVLENLGPPPWYDLAKPIFHSIDEEKDRVRNSISLLCVEGPLHWPNLFERLRLGSQMQRLSFIHQGPGCVLLYFPTRHVLLQSRVAACDSSRRNKHNNQTSFTQLCAAPARPPPLPPDLALKNVAPLFPPPARPPPQPPWKSSRLALISAISSSVSPSPTSSRVSCKLDSASQDFGNQVPCNQPPENAPPQPPEFPGLVSRNPSFLSIGGKEIASSKDPGDLRILRPSLSFSFNHHLGDKAVSSGSERTGAVSRGVEEVGFVLQPPPEPPPVFTAAEGGCTFMALQAESKYGANNIFITRIELSQGGFNQRVEDTRTSGLTKERGALSGLRNEEGF